MNERGNQILFFMLKEPSSVHRKEPGEIKFTMLIRKNCMQVKGHIASADEKVIMQKRSENPGMQILTSAQYSQAWHPYLLYTHHFHTWHNQSMLPKRDACYDHEDWFLNMLYILLNCN